MAILLLRYQPDSRRLGNEITGPGAARSPGRRRARRLRSRSQASKTKYLPNAVTPPRNFGCRNVAAGLRTNRNDRCHRSGGIIGSACRGRFTIRGTLFANQDSSAYHVLSQIKQLQKRDRDDKQGAGALPGSDGANGHGGVHSGAAARVERGPGRGAGRDRLRRGTVRPSGPPDVAGGAQSHRRALRQADRLPSFRTARGPAGRAGVAGIGRLARQALARRGHGARALVGTCRCTSAAPAPASR